MIADFTRDVLWKPSIQDSFDSEILVKRLQEGVKDVKKLIDAKAKGQKRQAPLPQPARSNVIDIVATLQGEPGAKDAEKRRCCLTSLQLVGFLLVLQV